MFFLGTFNRLIVYCKNYSLTRNLNTSIGKKYLRESGFFSQSNKCLFCKGFKYIKCLECDGNGKHYLGGYKEMLCDFCLGKGNIPCNFCGGSGKNYLC